MHLVYIDDAKDDKLACFAAISIPEDSWRDALDHLNGMRRAMKAADGLLIRPEIHATDY
jgi:hypothetical protein